MSERTYRDLERDAREQLGTDLRRLSGDIRTRIIEALQKHDEAERGIQANPGWDAPPPDPASPLAVRAQYRKIIRVHRALIKSLLNDASLDKLTELAREMRLTGRLPTSLMERVAQLVGFVAAPVTVQEPSPGNMHYNPLTETIERVVRSEPIGEDNELQLIKCGESVCVRVVLGGGAAFDDIALDPKDAVSVESVTRELAKLGTACGLYWLSDVDNVANFFNTAFIVLFVIDGLHAIRHAANPQPVIDMMSDYARLIRDGRQGDISVFMQKWTENLCAPIVSFLAYTAYVVTRTASSSFDATLREIPTITRGRLYYQIIDEIERAKAAVHEKPLVTAGAR
jgi:hypothetical protein